MLLRHVCCVAHPHLVTPCVMYFTFMTSNLIIYSSNIFFARPRTPSVAESFASGCLRRIFEQGFTFYTIHPPTPSQALPLDCRLPCRSVASLHHHSHPLLLLQHVRPSQAEYPGCSFHFPLLPRSHQHYLRLWSLIIEILLFLWLPWRWTE